LDRRTRLTTAAAARVRRGTGVTVGASDAVRRVAVARAVGRAAVAGLRDVTVVRLRPAFEPRRPDRVLRARRGLSVAGVGALAADRSCGLDLTRRRAAVAARRSPVVALLAGLDAAVATHGSGRQP